MLSLQAVRQPVSLTMQLPGCAGYPGTAKKTNTQNIEHHARPRQALATAPLRTDGQQCDGLNKSDP